MNILIRRRSEWQRLIVWVALGVAFCGLVWATYFFMPDIGKDWKISFRPAVQKILSFQSPYSVTTFYNPPWALLPLLPLGVLPEQLGFAINFWVSIVATGYVAFRRGAKPWAIVALLVSYPVLFMSVYGQIDWLIYIGLVLPPQWGLFFVLVKPQASIGIVIFWLVEALRQKGIKKTVWIFAPVVVAFLLSFCLFGLWFQNGFSAVQQEFNASLWPQSIPIGLALLIYSLHRRNESIAVIASPFLSPYLAPHGWGVALLGLSAMPLELVVSVIGLWVVRFLTGYFLH